MALEHPTELLGAFALGCLDADERERVETHLAACADCRHELTAYMSVADRLAEAAPEIEPPDRIEKQLMARIKPRKTYAWFERLIGAWPRMIPIFATASFVAVVALGGYNIATWLFPGEQELMPAQGVMTVWLTGTDNAPKANASLILDSGARRGLLVVNNLEPLPHEWEYQLWLIKNGQRKSGGVFSVTADGNAQVVVSPDLPITSFDALGITIEPCGGSPGPTGKKVLGGLIRS